MNRQYLNGTLWQAPNKTIALLQYLSDGHFVLLAIQERASHGGSCLCMIAEEDATKYYREHALPARLEEWTPLPGRMLVVDKSRAVSYLEDEDE